MSDDAPVFGPVVIGGHAVVGIHPVGAGWPSGAKRQKVRAVSSSWAVLAAGCATGTVWPGRMEEQHLVKFAGQIVPPGGQNFLIVVGDAAQTQHLHPLRQIDRPAMGVLGVDGCDHQALAKKQLVVHLPGVGVGRVIKAKGRK